jgi:hypothetical protein
MKPATQKAYRAPLKIAKSTQSRLPFDSATRGDDTLAFAFEFPVLRMIEDAGQ